MRRFADLLISLVMVAVFCSCTPGVKVLDKKPPAPASIHRDRAMALEEQGELQQALFTWQIVAQLEKDNPEAAKAIQTLKKTIAARARNHFQKGLKHYRSGEYKKARIEFLIAVRNQPTHRKALHYLRTRLQHTEQATYTVQSGDSFTRIAAKVYKDPGKAYIIANFNDLDPRKPLMIGKTLLLPTIATAYLKRRSNISIWLEQAKTAYGNKRYEETLALTQKIQEVEPQQPDAKKLADAANFGIGMQLYQQKQYLAAVAQFKKVPPGFKGLAQAIAKAREHIRQLALDEKLSLAQEHLRNSAWESVLITTEEILDHDPNNEQAKMLFSNASYNLAKLMLDRGDVVMAVKLLDRIDSSYEDTGALLALARARMKSQAETHYRDGVKHFINEDLESAINEWKKALNLNPEHPKAKQDIENAQRLLEKLKALE